MHPTDSQLFVNDPDFDLHPIWYCQHSDDTEVDFVFTPAIGATEVDQALCQRGFPCIPLLVHDTQLRCLGYYDVSKDMVFGIAIWMIGEWRKFSYIDAPRTPVIIVSQVSIFGVAGRRFLQQEVEDWYAKKVDA